MRLGWGVGGQAVRVCVGVESKFGPGRLAWAERSTPGSFGVPSQKHSSATGEQKRIGPLY